MGEGKQGRNEVTAKNEEDGNTHTRNERKIGLNIYRGYHQKEEEDEEDGLMSKDGAS